MEYNKEQERHLSRPACGALTLRFLLHFERLPPKSQLSLFSFFLQQLSRFQCSPLQWQKVPLIFQLFLFCLNLWQNAGRESSMPKSHIPVIVSSSNIRLFCVSVFLYQDFLGLWENLLRGLFFLLKQSFFTDRAWCGCWGKFDLGNMTNNESLLLSICCKKRFFCLW